jgi:8-oxo-dGTP diphosphatase
MSDNKPRTSPSSDKVVHVAVAVVCNAANEVLLALRPDHAHQGGLWEFPGGKVEPAESVEQALKRELLEEVGITVQAARPFMRLHYNYPDKSVLLDIWRVRRFSGTPHGREGQPVRWVSSHSLGGYSFPAANAAIVKTLQLPSQYLITPSPTADMSGFLSALEKSLQNNIKLVQFRAPDLPLQSYLALADEVLSRCQQYGARLLLNCDPKYVEQVGAHGVHLNSQRLNALSSRPLSQHHWVAASCHNAGEIARANVLRVDFAVLGPVTATLSHPGAATLGWETFQQLAEAADFPVYALGGMSAAHLESAQLHGAYGIAAIRALWQDN